MVCLRSLPEGEFLCAECDAQLARLREPYCSKCSQPFEGAITQDFVCSTCEGRHFYFLHAISTRRNIGLARHLIHRFKYQRQYHLRHILGQWLCECLHDKRLLPFDLVVPVPLHPTRLREREFNQAESLARILAGLADKPLCTALQRVRRTETQTHFQRARRMENLRDAFGVHAPEFISGRHILLIDDVFTTGSTVNECAKTLLQYDAASVQVATAARS